MRVEHEPTAHRFVARLTEGEAELTYREVSEGVLDFNHTYVPPEGRGEGVGEALAEAAFRHARENGYRVRPSCPFVRRWLDSHPEEQALVAT